jgi:hypothetical protein
MDLIYQYLVIYLFGSGPALYHVSSSWQEEVPLVEYAASDAPLGEVPGRCTGKTPSGDQCDRGFASRV